MWATRIESSFTEDLVGKMSEHFQVLKEYTTSESEVFFFTSSHLDNINLEDPLKASYRSKALLRILNGILLLTDDFVLNYDVDHLYFIQNNNDWLSENINQDNRSLEYQELQNPFQADLSQLQKFIYVPNSHKSKKNYIVDFFDYAYKDEWVREVLILFSLSKIDTLFILINTYKILETIKHDLQLNVRESEKQEKLAHLQEVLGQPFIEAYNHFENGRFGQYSNTNAGSGLYARHGANRRTYNDREGNPLPPVSFEEIDDNIRTLIYEWINYKVMCDKGYRYPSVKRKSRIEPLRDEDFIFKNREDSEDL